MSNLFNVMSDILICYANAAEESEDENEIALRFSAKVQTLMGMSMSRKIQALSYLFDNQLGAVARIASMGGEEHESIGNMTKEDAFTALQMAITAQAVNYQNGDNS